MARCINYARTDLEVLVACGAEEVFGLEGLRSIKENWIGLGNYEEPHHIYGYPVIVARVLVGDSGKRYIYWI